MNDANSIRTQWVTYLKVIKRRQEEQKPRELGSTGTGVELFPGIWAARRYNKCDMVVTQLPELTETGRRTIDRGTRAFTNF